MGDFSRKLNRIIEQRKATMFNAFRAALFRTGQQVITMSPVMSGRFKGNWLYSYDDPDTSTSNMVDLSGQERIGALNKTLSEIESHTVFYMTNSLPYAFRLEYEGWSKNVPDGMVRVSFQGFNAKLQEELRRNG